MGDKSSNDSRIESHWTCPVLCRYGRFPSANGPFRTILAHQAHGVDTDFYERFYKPDVFGSTAR
jgi:hypothetical protein